MTETSLDCAFATNALRPSGEKARPKGSLPTGISRMTDNVPASTTLTVFEVLLVT